MLTGAAIWLSTQRLQWPANSRLLATLGAMVLVGVWRLLANIWQLNDDFLPLVSIGDVMCLVVGAIAPAVVGLTMRSRTTNRWLPAVIGGIVGFLINVVVL